MKPGFDQPLAPAIQSYHADRDSQYQGTAHFSVISRTAAAQAAQIVGKSGSLPVSVVYFQQRSHLIPPARSIVAERGPSDFDNSTSQTINRPGKSFR